MFKRKVQNPRAAWLLSGMLAACAPATPVPASQPAPSSSPGGPIPRRSPPDVVDRPADTAASVPPSAAAPNQPAPPATPALEQPSTTADAPKSAAGWRRLAVEHQGRADWASAAVALREASKLQPGDSNLLAELGFALLKAGELEASTAVHASLLYDELRNELKAQVLYNQARVEKARGRTIVARKLLEESLAQRPHPTVSALLTSLPEQSSLCADQVPLQSRCDCERVEAYRYLPELLNPSTTVCKQLTQALLGRLVLVEAGEYSMSAVLLIDLRRGSLVLARVTDLANPGALGISEEFQVTKLGERQLAGKTLVEITWTHRHIDHDNAGADGGAETNTFASLCVLNADDLTCPHQIKLATETLTWGTYAGLPPMQEGTPKVTSLASYRVAQDGTLRIQHHNPQRTEQSRLW